MAFVMANQWRCVFVNGVLMAWLSIANDWRSCQWRMNGGVGYVSILCHQPCNSNNTKNLIIVSFIRQVKNHLMNRTLKQKERLSSYINAHQLATVVDCLQKTKRRHSYLTVV